MTQAQTLREQGRWIDVAMFRILHTMFIRRTAEFGVFANDDRFICIYSKKRKGFQTYSETHADKLIGVYTPESSAIAILDDLKAYFGVNA